MVEAGADLRALPTAAPRDYHEDRGPKRKQYVEHGVAEVWLPDADERTVEVWHGGATEPEVARDALDGRVAGHELEITLEDVFRA